MRQFKQLKGIAVPLLRANIDTDAIIPSREMKRVSKIGLGEGLFANWRYDYDGDRKTGLQPDFVLNRPEYSGASILLGGENFGCGSSREHAVWALADFGFRALLAPSFGSIFQRNCYRNGILPVVLPEQVVVQIAKAVEKDPQQRMIRIDLDAQELTSPDGEVFPFEIASGVRERLLAGTDEIDLTLQYADDISKFRERRCHESPWTCI